MVLAPGCYVLSPGKDDDVIAYCLDQTLPAPASGAILSDAPASFGDTVVRLRLLQSSGADILDKAGMGAIERSAPFRPLPPDILGDKVELVVAVHMAP